LKILYCGVTGDGTGWGKAAQNYILAMDHIGLDVVHRPIRLNSNKYEVPARIEELEKKSPQGCTHIIQHILPHYSYYAGPAKNICMFASESSNFVTTSWVERLNTLDEAWVFNWQSANVAENSGVNVPIRVIPHCFDITTYQKKYEPFHIPEIAGTFKFYFIGEFVRRKNLGALLKAFHSTFEPHEPVSLVIKSNIPGKSKQESADIIRNFCRSVKEGLKLRPIDSYAKEVIITQRLSDADILRLHATCDCFVMPSYGEAWCIPAFEAMAMGKPTIATKGTGFLDYMTEETSFLVPARKEPVFGCIDTFGDLMTAREEWDSIDISWLKSFMREIYDYGEKYDTMSQASVERAKAFDYRPVGELIAAALAV